MDSFIAEIFKKRQHCTHGKAIYQAVDKHLAATVGDLGVDCVGTDPRVLRVALRISWWLYRRYFRVQVHGWQHVPPAGFIVAANHSGQMPFDAPMISTGFLLDNPKPVLLHSMVDRWVARLPFLSVLYARTGQVIGHRGICKTLLHKGHSVLLFPEGVRGITKPFSQRYQLQQFGHGFMRLAMTLGRPVLPVALIGAEEQAIAVANIKPLAALLGIPRFPLVLPQLVVPIPLPVRYTLYIGKSMHFASGTKTPGEDQVARNVARVRRSIQRLIAVGLKRRTSIFY